MSEKLTREQERTLSALSGGEARSAYPGLRLGTLYALNERGLAHRINMPGSIAMPRTRALFRITDAGREALRLAKGDQSNG